MSAETIQITLPDGATREVPRGTTAAQIAHQISPRLAKEALVARANGDLVDLSRPLEHDAKISILTAKDPDAVQVFRHSAAHLLAAAVLELYPNVKLGIGPPIENGFFYEFVREEPFTQDDLEKIEAKMHELAAKDVPNERKLIAKPEALELYRKSNQEFKCELVEEKATEPMVSFYTTGKFIDFCRGPHIPSTGRIKAFKLMNVSGAYWKGKEGNPQMQRIYGACFVDQKELDEYLHKLEEAKRRDHRRIGKELGLFAVSDQVGSGLPLWLPKGATIRRVLEDYILEKERRAGYQHVYTPDLAKVDLYVRSGHWAHYHEDMFPPMDLETEQLVLRPMNCPHHILVYESKKHSYRDLPVRIAELGTMYRYERSGVLSGLSRVRCMTLNDAHIFCTPEQIKEEFAGVMRLVEEAYRDLGITQYSYRLSLRDKINTGKYVANDEMWDLAEDMLREAMNSLGLPYTEAPGEAAFYGPKLDIQLADVMGHQETYSTIQIDFHLPNQFELGYVGADGQEHRPVMIHRGVISTMERMVSYLIELYAGAFPAWLAPVQAVVLPITERQNEYARQVHQKLLDAGARVELDDRNEKLQAKIRDAQLQKIPYMLIVGGKEAEAGTVSVRHRSKGDLGPRPLDQFRADLRQEIDSRAIV
ncbi:MAG TPA: threonine--tRNA ligase [Candidatus Acidoferrales bacterium]|jgi:threonyl-tRNA synthetase|nr:threonine--tRNA ligase [Candidatus Acidoferrales bacterium]